jgi:hypothetical protein
MVLAGRDCDEFVRRVFLLFYGLRTSHLALRVIGGPYYSIEPFCASQQNGVSDFRFGSKADIALAPVDVRFAPNSGHR